jgi:pimeloyl-ACP methyl ester carboxylesterase
MVAGIIELGPFTRKVKSSIAGLLRVRRYRRGALLLMRVMVLHSLKAWVKYLDIAYPQKPVDYEAYTSALRSKLSEPGRMAEFLKALNASSVEAGDALPRISCPALVIMGDEDPDFANPRAEAEEIVAAMAPGLGTATIIKGAGHYPQAQTPDEVANLVTRFIRQRVPAPGKCCSLVESQQDAEGETP